MNSKISINCHSSIKISDEKIIYFDPYDINEKISDADYIFITHDHYDHLDIKSIKNVINENTTVIIPTTVAKENLQPVVLDEQIIGVCPNEQYCINGINVHTIPSYNIDKDFHKKIYNWVGYIIEYNNEKIYVAGDTDANDEVKKVKCDIALVPIGGTYTMTLEEAANLINLIKPKHVIPTHYGKIVGEKEDGEKFKELINPEINCHLLIK